MTTDRRKVAIMMSSSMPDMLFDKIKEVSKKIDIEKAKYVQFDEVKALPKKLIKPRPIVNEHFLLGRNDPCHCGSGKKYKRCCL